MIAMCSLVIFLDTYYLYTMYGCAFDVRHQSYDRLLYFI